MKKILLLGGSAQQVVAIETAKKLGYYTILCDYLSDNPGQYVCDKFYLISTTDKETILEVAENENIDGIVAYASDPAAPTAAYVSEKMGLPTNSYKSVEILSNKKLFREFLADNGFNVPGKYGFNEYSEETVKYISKLNFPVMIKPVDSSGSKGITKLYDIDGIKEAIDYANKFSRCKEFIAEEFIEKTHDYLIGGDVFVLDGKVEFWGLLNCHRDKNVNPLVPVGKSYPLSITDKQYEIIKIELQRLMNALDIKFGAFNMEMIFANDELYIIEAGPRNGGNMIPDLLQLIYGVNLIEITLKCAMGDSDSININQSNIIGCYSTFNLHSSKNGILKNIKFHPELEQYILKKLIYIYSGDQVEYFDNASKALGIIFTKFDSKEKMIDMIDNSDRWIEIELEE